MFNNSIRIIIDEIEYSLKILKQDYKIMEEKETDSMRYEVKKDIENIKIKLDILLKRINKKEDK